MKRRWLLGLFFALALCVLPARAVEVGPYIFELEEGESGAEVYLIDPTAPDSGVLLPHMGEGIRERGIQPGVLEATENADGTVELAVYDVEQGKERMLSLSYPTSSLDWCLENLNVQFRHLEPDVEGGAVSLKRYWIGGSPRLLRQEWHHKVGWCGWERVDDVPFQGAWSFLPYNGKTFMVEAEGKLYASEDGLSWKSLPGWGTTEEYNRAQYSFVWTGEKYISCRRVIEVLPSRFENLGKKYDPACTKVSFLNEDFEVVDAYDFGRQVEAVGYVDGAYYARVSTSVGVSNEEFDHWAPDEVYRSTDGKVWELLPAYYTAGEELMVAQQGAYSQVYHPTGDPDKPQRSIAQLDRWRFVLNEDYVRDYATNLWEDHSIYRVYLMGEAANDWVELPHLGQAIEAQGIAPWELTAAYLPDGTVDVKVADKDGKYISIAYPTSSLDWVRENLLSPGGARDYSGDENFLVMESAPGIADVGLFRLANEEKELVYRSAATGGRWAWFDSVPWGNDIALLEYSGKDFMVLDKADGRLYLSSDGVNWHEAAGEWYKAKQQSYFRGWTEEMSSTLVSAKLSEGESGCCTARYAMKWVGDKYMAVCFWQRPSFAVATKVVWIFPNDPDMAKVLYLDEELNLIGSHDFGYMMTEVGFQDGVYFARTNGHIYKYGDFSIGGPERLFISTDGENWQESDLLNVQDCMVKLQ